MLDLSEGFVMISVDAVGDFELVGSRDHLVKEVPGQTGRYLVADLQPFSLGIDTGTNRAEISSDVLLRSRTGLKLNACPSGPIWVFARRSTRVLNPLSGNINDRGLIEIQTIADCSQTVNGEIVNPGDKRTIPDKTELSIVVCEGVEAHSPHKRKGAKRARFEATVIKAALMITHPNHLNAPSFPGIFSSPRIPSQLVSNSSSHEVWTMRNQIFGSSFASVIFAGYSEWLAECTKYRHLLHENEHRHPSILYPRAADMVRRSRNNFVHGFILDLESGPLLTLTNFLKQTYPEGMAEEDALQFFRQILSGYRWIVDRGLEDPDLRSNKLFVTGNPPQIVILEAGNLPGKAMEVRVPAINDLSHRAPEVQLRNEVGRPAELFQLGAVFAQLLTGKEPDVKIPDRFLDTRVPSRDAFICKGVTGILIKKGVSQTTLDLIHGLMRFKSSERMDLLDVLHALGLLELPCDPNEKSLSDTEDTHQPLRLVDTSMVNMVEEGEIHENPKVGHPSPRLISCLHYDGATSDVTSPSSSEDYCDESSTEDSQDETTDDTVDSHAIPEQGERDTEEEDGYPSARVLQEAIYWDAVADVLDFILPGGNDSDEVSTWSDGST